MRRWHHAERSAGKELKADWKSVKPNELEVKLPLQEAKPGAMTLWVTQSGVSQPQQISIQTFAEAGHFDGFAIHAGDAQGVLKGSRLDEVASLSIRNVVFMPGELSTRNGGDELPMVAQDAQAAASLKQERGIAAKVTLKDGRVRTADRLRGCAAPARDPDRQKHTTVVLQHGQQHPIGRRRRAAAGRDSHIRRAHAVADGICP